ncbi:MAG TPA: hypothetical protein VGR35_20510 [Tepidisphaeraceae bacterium]|nr:hypothetical protein [Tepidisphaeraceae bacterium]
MTIQPYFSYFVDAVQFCRAGGCEGRFEPLQRRAIRFQRVNKVEVADIAGFRFDGLRDPDEGLSSRGHVQANVVPLSGRGGARTTLDQQ